MTRMGGEEDGREKAQKARRKRGVNKKDPSCTNDDAN
jgi:hypothetical protein